MAFIHYLAEIVVKNYEADVSIKSVSIEEVLAEDVNDAKLKAYEQFTKRCQYEPIMRRRMAELKLDPVRCYVLEVIAVD